MFLSSLIAAVLLATPHVAVQQQLLLGAGGGGGAAGPPSTNLQEYHEDGAGQLWQDSTCNTTAATVTNDVVGCWKDGTANGRNLTQATTSKKPLLETSAQNGHAAVVFDGTDDWMETSEWARTQPTTVYLVAKQTSWTIDDELVSSAQTLYILLMEQRSSSGEVRLYSNAGCCIVAAGTTVYRILSATFNGASSEMRLDGGAAVTGDAGAGAANGLSLGAAADGTLAVNAKVVGVYVYGTTYNSAVYDYISARYALP